MRFHYSLSRTIAAIATPLGEGGIAVIRISGQKAFEIGRKCFSRHLKEIESHKAYVGYVCSPSGELLDHVIMTFFQSPRSYTGEDVVEVSCHGGTLITRKVLELILLNGAEPAQPGEFTFRAFMNEKMDLAQAEAVQGLVSAKNEYALNVAEDQLQGRLSKKVKIFQEQLVSLAAILEAWVDFPEEGLEFASMEDVLADLLSIVNEIQMMLNSFHEGKILTEGLKVSLIGRPNVGKSSLMNALLDKERAIVTQIPGTTRDLLEDRLILNGLHILLTDTAGIRDTEEIVEKEGIRRSKQSMEEADIVLFVLDASIGLTDEDRKILECLNVNKSIVIWNKVDLNPQVSVLDCPFEVCISAKQSLGIDLLKEMVNKVVWQGGAIPSKEDLILTNVRHKDALKKCLESCLSVIEGLKNEMSPEFLVIDMRDALQSLGTIIGSDITEDILGEIFSKFCIGK